MRFPSSNSTRVTLDAFWKLIDDARQASAKLVDVPARLTDALSQMEEREIIDFDSHFGDCMHRSYDARLWLGAVVILGGCGDDRFTDFRCWLIAQGRQAFESALADPDSMASLERFDGDYGEATLFYLSGVAKHAFCKRTVGDPDDFAATERFESLLPPHGHPPLKNDALVNKSEREAKSLFPKLASKFPGAL